MKNAPHSGHLLNGCSYLVIDSTDEIGWYCNIDFLGVGQLQVFHDGLKLLLGFRQPDIGPFLDAHGGAHAALVVVAWIHFVVVGQSEDLRVHALVQQ